MKYSWMSRAALTAACLCLLAVSLPKAAETQALTVNVKAPGRTLAGTAFGVNLSYWGDNHGSLAEFKEAGFKSVRYPGGSNSDVFDWTTTNATQPWPQFVADMKAAGVPGRNIILTCNYGKANDDAARDGRPGSDLTHSVQPVSGATVTRSFPQYSATLMTFRPVGAVLW